MILLKNTNNSLIISLILVASQTIGAQEKTSADQALATIGYLSQQKSKKSNNKTDQEDLRLFIKKIVLLVKSKDMEKYPGLCKFNEKLKRDFDNIEVQILINALSDAAHIIKNRAEKICSVAEVEHLTKELDRWCEFAAKLVNTSLSSAETYTA